MSTAQVSKPTAPAPAVRTSARFKDRPGVDYRSLLLSKPVKQSSYHVYDIIDRSSSPPPKYRVRWWGYQDPAQDTWESRENLIDDGFEDLCNHIDAFKAWAYDGEEGEVRTLAMFRKQNKV